MTSVSGSVPTHGNYHNYHGYHSRHPGAHDPRLELLPSELLLDARILDIGCNEGWVSCEIAQLRAARRVVGVDIDDVLVRMAWKRRRMLWSHQEPSHSASSTPTPHTVDNEPPKKKRKRNAGNSTPGASKAPPLPRPDYFPASCQHMLGPLPIPPNDPGPNHSESSASPQTFPHNVSFRRADWVNEVIPEDAGGYDVILAFSISKWIHLNQGDEGLRRFFQRVHDALVPGGTFVFEPQQWDSYTKARKLHPTLQENAKNLEMHPDGFEDVLREIGFGPAKQLGAPGQGRFKRPVELYVKSKV
ncbi:Bin3-domain-containing protein [Auriscalpium vulgare]|uniref:Bin3-domain-containing protein n=1 Tax=Auriscalpium vulgare TaxID=40419 RepID=A0ACB8S269_9AGAM|nr:Bin3-domain-containing protein [Auriscalpium vulgare]